MAHPLIRPESRSRVKEKVDRITRLMILLLTDDGASMEEDSSRLREVSRLAASAAHDLDPQTVKEYLSRARYQEAQTDVDVLEWEREATRRASVYSDPACKAWIWERMRRWAGQ